MKGNKHPRKRLRWRTRALLNIGCAVLAVLVWYAGRGFPYFSWEQDLRYALRRNLAGNAEVFYSAAVPDGLGSWSKEARETVYLLRWGDTVGAMRMMKQNSGSTWFFGPNRTVHKYPGRDGLCVIPLYGAFPDGSGQLEGLTVAIVPLDPGVERVEVLYASGSAPQTVHPAQKTAEGIFIAEVRPGNGERFLQVGIDDELLAHNSLGAIGYDGAGSVVSQTAPAWSEVDYENR